jgi:PAS domain S-box-containing protein
VRSSTLSPPRAQLRDLAQACELLLGAADRDACLQLLARHAGGVVGARLTVVGLSRPDDVEPAGPASYARDSAAPLSARDAAALAAFAWASLASTKPLQDAAADFAGPTETGLGSRLRAALARGVLVVPLDSAAGMILVADPARGRFTADDECALLQLAAVAAAVIQRCRAETALHQAESRLRRAFDIETAGVIFFDQSGRITAANDTFLRLSGYERADLVTGPWPWTALLPPDWRVPGLEVTREFATLGRITPREVPFLRKDGARWWALIAATRVSDTEGVQFIIDVTERRRTDEELNGVREGLEIRVQERTSELDAANGALRDEIVERERAEQARQNLLRQLVTAQEEERRRISRELHDEVGQHITALQLGLRSLEGSVASPPPAQTLQELFRLAECVGTELHQMALKLRPTALDDLGLVRTLSNYVEEWGHRSGLKMDFHSAGWEVAPRLPSHLETTVYRIVQEALTNILKHARARRVSVILERRSDQVIAIVEDNGVGFAVERTALAVSSQRLGLVGMKERAALVAGELNIESSPGAGTTVFVRIPLPARAPGSMT